MALYTVILEDDNGKIIDARQIKAENTRHLLRD